MTKKKTNVTNSRRGEFTFKVDNKDINLLFNLGFWKILGDNGYKLEDLDKNMNGEDGVVEMLTAVTAIIYSGGLSYAKKNKTSFEYDQDEIFDWFESDIDEKVIEKMFKVVMQTQIFGKTLGEGLGKSQPS